MVLMLLTAQVKRVSVSCILSNRVETLRRVSKDSNLKRFKYKVLWARRTPTLNMGEFRVAGESAGEGVWLLALMTGGR